MGKKIRTIIFVIALAVFVGAVAYIGVTMLGYKKEAAVHEEAVATFTTIVDTSKVITAEEDAIEEDIEYPPISVDFNELLAVNPDVIGWIYCEDTVINYPILRGTDNDYYLHHNYLGQYVAAGSIFANSNNEPDFSDSNTIIYGHHMKDGSMFNSLSKWGKQDYFDEHSVMWILTPTQNYKVLLFSEYTTDATSDTYSIIKGPCDAMDKYIEKVALKSNVKADVELYSDDHYVVLSTCAYVFENARSVIHGKLVPVGMLKPDME